MSADGKIYVMFNKANGARIKCTENFLAQWLARGFEVESIEQSGGNNLVAGVYSDDTTG